MRHNNVNNYSVFERESSLAGRAGRRLDEKKIKVRNANAQENELTFAYDALSGPTEHFKILLGTSIYLEDAVCPPFPPNFINIGLMYL